MQRVAMELDAAIVRLEAVQSDPETQSASHTSAPTSSNFADRTLEYDRIVLTASWKWVHILAVPFLIRAYVQLALKIRRREVDVILFSSMVTAALAIFLKRSMRANGVKAAAIVHGQDVTKPVRIYQLIVPKIFAALDMVLPVSGATGEACVKRGLAAQKVAVVHNGVNLDRFTPYEWPTGNRSKHAFRTFLPPDALLLASVGRQVKRKGFAWFIENVMPNLPEHIHYWLGGDGPEHDRILEAIQHHKLEQRVKLLGRLGDAELTDLYQSADVFLMPNIPIPGDMEGFGIVMLEAAMNGLPAVAARLEGIREVITPGKNGYFVESGDVSGYVSKICALDEDRDALQKLSSLAKTHVAETFGWDAVAQNYISALRRLSS